MSTPALTLPSAYEFGFVVCRAIRAVADGPDEDSLPEAIPSVGSVTFTPKKVMRKVGGPRSAFVEQGAWKFNLHSESGELVDKTHESTASALVVLPDDAGTVRAVPGAGVWLYAGEWTVKYSVEPGSIASHDITVLTTHSQASPLDLVTASPDLPSPGESFTSLLVPASLVNGKILGVVDGKLAWVDNTGGGPGGSSPVLTWVGNSIAIDGVVGPNLKGEKGDAGVGISEVRWNGVSWGTRPAGAPWGLVLTSANDENAPAPTAAFGLLKGDVLRKLVLP